MKRNFLIRLLPFIIVSLPVIGASGTTVELSAQDKKNVLDMHNKTRCDLSTPAAAMPNLLWNDLLYQVAQNHANKCVFAHNGDRSSQYAALGGKGYVGENIYMISGVKAGVYLTQALNSFASEKVNFSYMSPSACKRSGSICGCLPSKVCGHYTQMIWDHTTTVACAQADCRNTSLKGQFVVCDYAPGGNYISTEPYISSTMPINTAACQAVYSNQLATNATLQASSNQDHLASLMDGNSTTFWSPQDNDPNPTITLSLKKPQSIEDLTIQWTDEEHAAKSIQVEYATQADGSDMKVVASQALSMEKSAKLSLHLSQVKMIKLQFLDAYGTKIQVSSLETSNN